MTSEQIKAILALCDVIEAADAAATEQGDYQWVMESVDICKEKIYVEIIQDLDPPTPRSFLTLTFPRTAAPELARLVREALKNED